MAGMWFLLFIYELRRVLPSVLRLTFCHRISPDWLPSHMALVINKNFLYYHFADNGLKTRLEMIKNHAISVLQELKVTLRWEVWAKSFAVHVFAYPRRQDEAVLPDNDWALYPARKWCLIINLSLNKLVWFRWLDIALFFCVLTKQKKERTWPISTHLDLMLGQ